MHIPTNKLFVTIEQKFHDTISLQSGGKLYIDPSWHPEEYSMMKATVVTVPDDIIERHDYKGMTMDIKPGDEILVRYDMVFDYKEQPDRDTPIYKNLVYRFEEESGNYCEYWRCDIQKVFAIIRDGKYIMLNGYVMLEPLMQMREDFSALIARADYTRMVQRKDKAIVAAIGKPLKGQPDLGVETGDIVYVNPAIVQEYSIDQEHFYIVRQSHLLAVAV